MKIQGDTISFETSAASLGNPSSFLWAVASECHGAPEPEEKKPAKGWRFVRWGGACKGSKPRCALPMTAATSVTALEIDFAPIQPRKQRSLIRKS